MIPFGRMVLLVIRWTLAIICGVVPVAIGGWAAGWLLLALYRALLIGTK